jgi:hypothetical protein
MKQIFAQIHNKKDIADEADPIKRLLEANGYQLHICNTGQYELNNLIEVLRTADFKGYFEQIDYHFNNPVSVEVTVNSQDNYIDINLINSETEKYCYHVGGFNNIYLIKRFKFSPELLIEIDQSPVLLLLLYGKNPSERLLNLIKENKLMYYDNNTCLPDPKLNDYIIQNKDNLFEALMNYYNLE